MPNNQSHLALTAEAVMFAPTAGEVGQKATQMTQRCPHCLAKPMDLRGRLVPLFDTGVRDDQWAPRLNANCKKRLASVKFDNVNVDSAACKTTTCQLVWCLPRFEIIGEND